MKLHKFKQMGMNIVIDVNSGAIHVVDDIVYDVLDYYKNLSLDEIINKLQTKYNKEQLEEAYDEIRQLEEEGMLYTEDPYKNIILNDNGPSYIKAMCLNIAHDCNLKCKYCFASEGDYKGERKLMSAEVGKKAIDFVIENAGPRRNVEIDLFGGEPLMNFKVVKEIVEYARQREKETGKNIRFTITTNATLLTDEIMDFIDENMGNVVLSIDGRKEVNDNIRIRYDGTGTFDDILPKIKKMVEKRKDGKQYYVRGTFTRENLDFYNDVMMLADEGFKEISIEPVVLEDKHPLSLREEDLETIYEQYDKLAEEIVRREKEGKGFKFYHFNIDVNGGPCVYKRISGCGAGYEYVAVTPDGDIYPCHQFVGNEDFKLGNVFTGIENNELIKTFKNGHIYNKPKCMECWARFYCSGGCQANNYSFNKDIHIPYELGCKMMKKRVECAIAIKAKLMEE
ncbi:thioether cross-link-forming SCIFF peptide maturase [Thermobrachium celere]|uniref:Transcriptional regulatory protein n=1 Tax=Thermobrachium celere DSM 8682 TaxID=941824 RepID=R7RSV4_9CLOT|nr:thioether cross-link-forming SCIFF peptide maturase [Thermobrachium celere]GFR35816.1 thioether cross-link-forming SCIFF peptide maturase [Thermobrachium celere]CDF58335.1 Transcriptional regulatory protein [Thermobrachium celere DSM 8682]